MTKKFFYILLLFLVLSLVSNFWLAKGLIEAKNLYKIEETKWANFNQGHSLLSANIKNLPLDSNQDPDRILLHFVPLKNDILKQIDGWGDSKKVGIYIQDATTGSWLGINENENFVPASLLKVPIAMAIYKKYELGGINLEDELIVREQDIDVGAGVPERYTVGNSYKVRELLEWMLKISDNTAKNILKGSLDPEELNSVFTHVGINNPYVADSDNQYVSPRQYERIFKALYFSTYLQPNHSQDLLTLLTDTRVEGLLSNKLPWEIQVSHKYGERADSLHDCGIVYNSSKPYFICIMTNGIDIATAKDFISHISLQTYDYFNSDK